ncbi:MAG: Fic family protein [Owenweeksia sp.]|nr:Fic family protein [Owenweeksia sp.]
MANLEQYINEPGMQEVDPLIKMAIIHFQFESIHPFYDGNGRTGRILNTLYLVKAGLLNLPILYLSRFIIQNKSGYYSGLQRVRDQNQWEDWLLYIGTGVEQTARHTITQIQELKALMQKLKFQLRDNYKFYSQDLLNHLFKHPYTKIEFLMGRA